MTTRPFLAAVACSAALVPTAAAAQSPERLRPARILEITPACRPVYPADALRAHMEGTTVLRFGIDASGRVVRSAIERPSGPAPENRSLDEEALAALAHCTFVTATDGDGRPAAGSVEVNYAWVINPAPPGPVAGPAPRPAVMDAQAPSCRPVYPQAALAAQAQGVSSLWYRIDAEGRVVESHVVHPSGPTPAHALLDQEALTSLAHCPIRPGRDEADRPVETVLQMDFRWQLN